MIKKLPRYQIPFLLLKFLKGKLLSLKPVSFIRCKTLKVLNMQPPLKLNMDGELEDMMPFAVRICEKALTIFTPKPIKA
jgi:diacylglycerol kinase family enzyme